MEVSAQNVFVVAISGALIGFIYALLGEGYYRKRFETKSEKKVCHYIISSLSCAFAGATFVSFSYGITEIIALLFFIACMLVAGRIDKAEHIIPNCIICLLFLSRLSLYTVDIFIDKKLGFYKLENGVKGLVVIGVILFVFSLFCKGKIGMGDIKALLLVSFYFGLFRSLLIMFAILFVAASHMIYKVIRRRVGVHEEISFGPYIAVGGYLALMLGI